MHKLVFYVPESHLEKVKEAVFAAGAGKIGEYDHCCWQVLGRGQFRPLAGSQPYLGELGKVEVLDEYRVEVVCEDKFISSVVQAMKVEHPYEEPAYDVWKLADI